MITKRDPYGDILVIVKKKPGAKTRRRHMKCSFGPLRRTFRSLAKAEAFATKLPDDLWISSITIGERSSLKLLFIVRELRKLRESTT